MATGRGGGGRGPAGVEGGTGGGSLGDLPAQGGAWGGTGEVTGEHWWGRGGAPEQIRAVSRMVRGASGGPIEGQRQRGAESAE